MTKKILIVSVTDTQSEKTYSERVDPYIESAKGEQIATSRRRLIDKYKLNEENCITKSETKTE